MDPPKFGSFTTWILVLTHMFGVRSGISHGLATTWTFCVCACQTVATGATTNAFTQELFAQCQVQSQLRLSAFSKFG